MGSKTPVAWVGVDLGGTGTRIAVVDDQGNQLGGETISTLAFGSDPITSLAGLIQRCVPPEHTLVGVGVGASGPVDMDTGVIHNPDTLPQFDGLAVASGLTAYLSVPTWIDNDSVVAGLAESEWGQAAGSPAILCVTLGTGVGVAMISQGTPVRASDGQHPEAGHIAVSGTGHPCYCGLSQCWEQLASRTALDHLQSSLSQDYSSVWHKYADGIAGGLLTLMTVYHPEVVVIGGSVAQHWAHIEGPLREALAHKPDHVPAPRLLASNLGERAGALGASLLPVRHIGWQSP